MLLALPALRGLKRLKFLNFKTLRLFLQRRIPRHIDMAWSLWRSAFAVSSYQNNSSHQNPVLEPIPLQNPDLFLYKNRDQFL